MLNLYSIIAAGAIFILYAIFLNSYWKSKIKEKSRQVKEAQAQVIQMEKMSSVGIMASGIAHEINNPLGFLISNLDSLKQNSQDLAGGLLPVDKSIKILDETKLMIEESLEGALRIKRIVSDLRTFSRRSESQELLVDINQIMELVLSIVWNEIKYKISLDKDYKAFTNILADPTQLTQVFLNIIINSSQAIEGKGNINISTYEDAGSVYAKISDTGCGMPKEVLPKIFDPFFSTKKTTGLGLYVSYNIIKNHGGDIKVESKECFGTTFIICLPKEKKGGEDEKDL
ncbi:MAG: ATP-binding protein [Candidatus Omnitrophota bacterium]